MRITLDSIAASYRVRTPSGDAVRTPWQTTLQHLADYQVALAEGDLVTALAIALAPDLDQDLADPLGCLTAFISQFEAAGSASGGADDEMDLAALFARLSARYGYRQWWQEPYPLVIELAAHLGDAETMDRLIGWEAAHADHRAYQGWHRDVRRGRDRARRKSARAPTHITREQFLENLPLDAQLIPRPSQPLPHEAVLAHLRRN